jgi:metal-responsive CopG/Arc/MetJ family transcriptional regulator
MKAAISVPDKLFKSGDALAKRLGISRSRLYSEALADMLARQRGKDITKRFNAVYNTEDSRLDEVVNELQVRSLPPARNDQW